MKPLQQKAAWIKEYEEKRAIASSTTKRAEQCIGWFNQYLKSVKKEKGRLLDVGCGLGRNSLPFLKSGWLVTAQDMVPAALEGYKQKARDYGRRLRLVEHSLMEAMPYKSNSFDALLEITVADNLITQASRKQFWRECARVVKPGGSILSYHFTKDDGFYGSLLAPSSEVVYDAAAGMRFRFYDAVDIVSAAGRKLELRGAKHYRYPGMMHNKKYWRDLMAVIFQVKKQVELWSKG